ncbi:hypothetical protein [Chloroflexus sp.]|uniref:hypothetical protein n=1 Tax=Chloroflexus sp. TaxID=1904827 RepID=UPI00404ACF66
MRPFARRIPYRRRETTGCVGQLVRLGLGILLIGILYLLLIRPQISSALGRTLADLIAPVSTPVEAADQAPLPALLAALPVGQVTVSEAEINGYLTDVQTTLPVDAINVRLRDGRAIVTIQAYGVTSVVSSGVMVRDGELIPLDPQVEGPLAMLISASDLSTVLHERLNAELNRQNRQIVDARITDGYLSIVTTSR